MKCYRESQLKHFIRTTTTTPLLMHKLTTTSKTKLNIIQSSTQSTPNFQSAIPNPFSANTFSFTTAQSLTESSTSNIPVNPSVTQKNPFWQLWSYHQIPSSLSIPESHEHFSIPTVSQSSNFIISSTPKTQPFNDVVGIIKPNQTFIESDNLITTFGDGQNNRYIIV